jgi:hypothetical protein
VLVVGVVATEVSAVEVVTVELEAAGLEVVDEEEPFEVVESGLVVWTPLVAPEVEIIEVLQAAVVPMDTISALAAATPVRFKNCRRENNATRKMFFFSGFLFLSSCIICYLQKPFHLTKGCHFKAI